MSFERREWRVEIPPDEDEAEVARHVISRVGTTLRTHCDRYDGARLHRGAIVFGGAHASHLVSAVVGRDVRSDSLALRVQVSGNTGARWSVVIFPLVTLATVLAATKVVGGAAGLLGGLLLGLVLGAAASYAGFVFASKTGGGAGARGRIAGVLGGIDRALLHSVEALGVDLTRATVEFPGIDDSANPPVGADWQKTLETAMDALAT